MRFLIQLVAVAEFLALAGPGMASRAHAAGACDRASGDESIAACTHAIENRKTPTKAQAVAYKNRGRAYSAKGDLDRAIADFGEAIRLDPKLAAGYAGRCGTYTTKGDYDLAIADCNEAIRLDPKLATAYSNRGYAYSAKDDLDRAIIDDSEAIRLDPKNLTTYSYSNRGVTYRNKGDIDHAIADLSEAIRLNPKDALSYHNRGLAYFYGGNPAKASADFSRASELDPKYAYNALWLDIAGQRSNAPSRLAQAISKIDMTAWPAPVIRMFLGEMTPPAVLAAADNPDAAKKRNQVCEADFYSGILALRQGAKDEAARQFRLAAADCPKDYDEAFAAGAELKALGAAP
jgi:lipoprotein NlpI